MKQRDINEVVKMYTTMSEQLGDLNNLLDNMLDAGLADSSEYKKVSNKFYLTCGAVQALQWVIEFRDKFEFDNN